MSKIPNNKNNNYSKKTISLKNANLVKKPLIEKEKIEKLALERILQKNVVYIIGLSYKLANKDILQKREYFGQYGSILKILTNKTKGLIQNSANEYCYSSYIYFSNSIEASLAILAVDNFKIENHYLKTSFGRTKYCSYFLKNLECLNKDCFYLHKLADKNDIIHGDDSRLLFHEQHVQAIKIANLIDANFKKKILAEEAKKNYESVFPKISSIFSKPVFLEFLNQINSNKINNINDACKIDNNYNNNSTVKLSLTSILNVNKESSNNNVEDKKNANIEKENSKSNCQSVLTNAYIDNFVSNTMLQIADTVDISKEDNGKMKINDLEQLKLADILRNEKQIKNNSPRKIKLADALIKITPLEKKVNPMINQNSKESEFNSSSNKNWTNKITINEEKNSLESRDETNSTEPQKIVDLIVDEILKFKIQENKNLMTKDKLAYNQEESKVKVSQSSIYSIEVHNDIKNEVEINNTNETILSYDTYDHKIKSNKNDEMNLTCVNNLYNSDQDNNKDFIGDVNNTLEDNKISYNEIEKNYTINNNNYNLNKKNENDFNDNKIKILDKEISLFPLDCKIEINPLELPSSKSIQHSNSDFNSDFKGEDFLIKTIKEKKASNEKTINKSNEINGIKNKINIVNTPKKFKENSNLNSKKGNPYILNETTKSDPRSSIISTTSCSVSPNISYNQEIDNQFNYNSINIYNKENKPFEVVERKKSIYTKRDISRFDFVSDNIKIKEKENLESNKDIGLNKNEVEIPEFIFDVLNKKFSRFSFFKRFKNEYNILDLNFLENKIIENSKDQSWADFIKNNLYP